MTTTSSFIIPVYRALTIAGNVIEKGEYGEVYHITVSDTTLDILVEVVFDVLPERTSS